ncbi:MAG: hypothetical protein AMXMBFR19_09230 [Chthonomonadaceae bacterium]|uniref:Uncharacterized protein n=1 Tax=Candidatus Nitrosymbiomonas proteolyticus TaxID=2608984 RepID=A0A809RWV1_9BACT|nr:hypothetical protein NPRO_19570 [Candidatus Nitrosymbiomonas proteolyticus]
MIQVPVAFYHAWLLLGFFGVSSYVAGRQGARSSLFLAVGVAVAYYCATHFRGSVIWYGTFDFYQEPTNGWLRMLIAGTLSGSILAWAVNRIKGAADWRSSRLLAIGSLGGLWFFGFLNWRENAVGFTDSVFAPTRHISILVTSLFLSIVFILGEIHR